MSPAAPLSIQKNKMQKLSQVGHLLRVGDEIITNADENITQFGFFQATILAISGRELACRRADGEEGGGEAGEWIITIDDSSPAQVMFYDPNKYVSVPKNQLKFGDVINYDGIPLVILYLLPNNRIMVRKFFEDGVRSFTINYSAPDAKRVFKAKLTCERDQCNQIATSVVPGYGVFCTEHAEAYGPIVTCHDCGIPIVQNEAGRITINRRSAYLCNQCHTTRREASRVIKNYSYKPIPLFITAEPAAEEWLSKLFLGLEQEVECPHEVPESAAIEDAGFGSIPEMMGKHMIDKFFEPKKWFYLKHDGSLSNGFEFVTHPATLSGHYSLPWEDVCNEYGALKIRADNTSSCGLHIHASKGVIDANHQIRLGYFVTINRPMMEKAARRTSGYARFKNPAGEIIQMNRNENGRYDALNWEPAQTVEFRMFKGTVLYDVLMASIEFAHACIAFTKNTTIERLVENKGSWSDFRRFVDSGAYRFLPKYLKERVG